MIVAEDARNLAHMVKPESEGGWGLDAVWSDDFQHLARRCLTGSPRGHGADFTGSSGEIAATIEKGWYFTGQHSSYHGAPRGTDPSGLAPERFVFFLQNHDQIANHAAGERLHLEAELAAVRAATVVLLLAPQTPLLFMGQEWAASTPFHFFTDHHEELGRLVTEGRRQEMARFRRRDP